MKKVFAFLIAAFFLALPLTSRAEEEKGIDAGSEIIGHVTDAHSWHLFSYVSDNDTHHVAVPLPVILINDGHVDIFMSSKLAHKHIYKGYKIDGGGSKKEEIICVDANGKPTGVKPFDLSITKTSAAIMVSVILLIII